MGQPAGAQVRRYGSKLRHDDLLEIVTQIGVVEEHAETSVPPAAQAQTVFDEDKGIFSQTIGRDGRAREDRVVDPKSHRVHAVVEFGVEVVTRQESEPEEEEC